MSDNKSEIKTEEDYKYEVSHAPTPHIVHVKKSPTKKILVGILIFVLIGACGYLGYAYYQEKDNANNLQQQLNSSQSQQSNQQESTEEQQTQADTVSYSADVGKFTLTLPNKYMIIRTIDGKGEGGEATYLNIGTKTDIAGVVDDGTSAGISGYKIVADPKVKFGDAFTLNDYIAVVLSDQIDQKTEKEKVTIGGVEASHFIVDGFGQDQYLFFTKDNNYYYISAIGVGSHSDSKLNDIVDGLKFN